MLKINVFRVGLAANLTIINQGMNNTNTQYDAFFETCRNLFIQKTKDYGTSWRVLRTISIVDQIFIKAQRIRTIQEIGHQKISDDISGEFQGIVNYGVIGLIQLEIKNDDIEELRPEEAAEWYEKQREKVKKLMLDKNHDYGEAWRQMSQESFVDLILMKLLRVRQILANDGRTAVSEGIDSNFNDIINYALFALILMEEHKQKKA